MKKLMLKDFIKYNSPCFNCKNKVDIVVCSENIRSPPARTQLRGYVTSSETKIPLKIGYSNSLDITVTHKDNIFTSNNMSALLKYFQSHRVHLISKCSDPNCNSFVESNELSLNETYCRLNPITLHSEYFYLRYPKNDQIILVMTNYSTEKTLIHFYEKNNAIFTTEVPTFNLMKLKTKEKFFEKMKLYLTFS
jgi:hypothetical protein